MFCQKCGKEIPDGSKSCPFCETESKPKNKKKGCLIAVIVVVALFVLIMVIGALSGGDESNPATNDVTTTTVQQDNKSTVQQDNKSTTKSEKTVKTSSTVSREFQNALKTAKSYSDHMYLSKQGIYDQLTSEYGEQFPADAAQYAIDNLQADYKYKYIS